MVTIALLQQKGGCSKTTTTVFFARNLQANGKRILIVDADPQQNCSLLLGVPIHSIPVTLADVWDGAATIQQAIQRIDTGLDVITGGLRLSSADLRYSGVYSRERMLQRELDKVQNDYDYCLIDCAPYLGLLTMTATTAAQQVIIPLTLDILAIQGFTQLYDFLQDVRDYCNPSLITAGILITQYNSNLITTKALETDLVKSAHDKAVPVFDTRIRYAQAVKTAQAAGDTSIYNSNSVNTAIDYRHFTEEYITKYRGT